MQKLKGTAIKELVESGRLRRADILLTHSKGSLWGWLIRLGTRCYWNHALLLYTVRDTTHSYDEVMIIDPRMGNICMGYVSQYLDNPNRYDVAVKRFEKEWFQDSGEEEGLSHYQAVSDIAWKEVSDKFDRRFIRLGRGVLRQVRIVYRFIRRRIKYPGSRKGRLSSIAERIKISAYGCSGFVQWCYYQGVSRNFGESRDKARLAEVTFNPRLTEPISQSDLLSTTPADLAQSDRLSWKYVVKDGAVWEVSSEEDVNSIIKPGI